MRLNRGRAIHAHVERLPVWARAVLWSILLAVLVGCSRNAPVQSEKRMPGFDIPLAAAVQASGSDLRAMAFNRNHLGKFIRLASEKFNADSIQRNFPDLALDPAQLTLAQSSRVRVYFVGAFSGYTNALGINSGGYGVGEGTPRLIFPFVRPTVGLYDMPNRVDAKGRVDFDSLGERTQDTPLMPGDFVDLGKLNAGTSLSFFLIAHADDQLVGVYTPIPELNADEVQHMVAVAVEGTPYLLLSFEDMFGGGDKDYSDCVFAVAMSGDNVAALLGKLDPLKRLKQLAALAAIAAIVVGGPLSYLAWRRYKRRRKLAQARQKAEDLIEAGRDLEAVQVLRECSDLLSDKAERLEWAGIEIRAWRRMDDVAHLVDLFERMPEAFARRERASLIVGRAELEAGRLESYELLRDPWRRRAQQHGPWLALDVDWRLARDEDVEARTLLEQNPLEGRDEASRLARMALMKAHENVAEAKDLMAKAVEVDPRDSDIRVLQGEFHEALGQQKEAFAAFQAAIRRNPKNPFARDRLAEFYRRSGEHLRALEAWREAMIPPSADYIWLKALFWRRVTVPLPLKTDVIETPPGPVRPALDFLMQLPESRFWNSQAFEPTAQLRQDLLSLQAVFWLRVLEALREGQDVEALSLLNVGAFGRRSWNWMLERVLASVLTYRRSGFPKPPSEADRACRDYLPRNPHPFLLDIEAGPTAGVYRFTPAMDRLLKGPNAFAAVCYAAGWIEAAGRLFVPEELPPDAPAWLQSAWADLTARREEARA